MRSLRIFAVGGLLSYRALFYWLTPSIYIPSLLVVPVFQVLFFAYLGRSAQLADDAFYVVGNSLQLASMPAIWAMGMAIAGERYSQTLSALIASPANRPALFLGRAVPVMLNGIVVSVFAFALGSLLLGVSVEASTIPPLLVVVVVTCFSCTGFGMAVAPLGLRWRETAVTNNLIFAVLLIFCGVNIPLDDLPGWMSTVAQGLPLTHGIEAARDVYAGSSLADVGGLLAAESAIGLAYLVGGLVLLRLAERSARRTAALELL